MDGTSAAIASIRKQAPFCEHTGGVHTTHDNTVRRLTEDTDSAFGLCDLGMGYPELGSVSLSEITALRGKLGLPVERDMWFKAQKTLSAYAEEASRPSR